MLDRSYAIIQEQSDINEFEIYSIWARFFYYQIINMLLATGFDSDLNIINGPL